MIHESWAPMRVIIPILLVLTLASGWYLHETARDRILEQESHLLKQQLQLREKTLNREIEDARLDVRFLYSTPPVKGIVRASRNNGIDPYDGTRLEQWKLRLEIIFNAFLENNPRVTQARYIGVANDGMELVRVDRRMGSINSVAPDRLQSKAHRDYFKAISQMGPTQFYVSEINLNREYGRVVIPYEPTYRVGIPIYDEQQQLFGMVILNYDAKRAVRELQNHLPDPIELILVNSRDGFISHPNPDYTFQQELGMETSWQDYYKTLPGSEYGLEIVQEQETGEKYYTRNTFIPVSNVEGGRFMRLMLLLPVTAVEQQLFRQSTQLLVVAGGVLLLIIVFLVIYQANVSKSLRLNEAQAQFEAIIEGSSDAIVGVSTSGVVISWNSSAQDIFGYSAKQAIGQPFEDLLVTSEKKDEVSAALRQVAMGKYQEPISLLLTKRNQSQLHVSMALSPIMINAHQVTGVAAIIRDVSTQVAAEEEIKHINASLEAQVQERTRELEAARNEALSASRTKSSFIANVSHEIRTPLNGIIGMHKMLRKATTQEQRDHYLTMAETSAGALSSLINDVLDLSKIEAGKLEFEHNNYDLVRVMSEIVLSMSIRAQDKGIDLILDTLDIDTPGLIGDPSRLRQIMINLIGNAIKFTDSGHVSIMVSTQEKPNGKVAVTLKVQDTGVGITPDKLDSIFEAFSQEDSSITRKFGGTGLGLSITQQLCKLMGGNIKAESTKGAGSTFTCTLTQEKMKVQPDYFSGINLAGKRFHIVGTSKPLVYNLSDQLEAWHADEVRTTTRHSILASLGELDHQNPDLLIIDESLVQSSGIDHCKTPVAVLSNQSSDSQLVLSKPVTAFKLATLLQHAGLISHFDFQIQSRDPDMPEDSGLDHPAPHLDLSNKRILIVDDNTINQEVALGLLEDCGADIHTALNGKEALSRLSAEHYDLILMDCQMPIMDGYTATEEIRHGTAGEEVKSTPIIAMTASAMAGDRDRCILSGMDDYITKPLDPDQLAARLTYWLIQDGQPPAAPPPETNSTLALSQLPIWDQQALFKRVRYKEDRMKEMVRIFSEITPEKVNQLCTAIRSEKLQQTLDLAHAIKGSAGNIGADRLQKVCELIETEVKKGPEHNLKPFANILAEELRLLMDALQKHEHVITSK